MNDDEQRQINIGNIESRVSTIIGNIHDNPSVFNKLNRNNIESLKKLINDLELIQSGGYKKRYVVNYSDLLFK